ncbi:unnamed protein product [Moneuplotes crassus]|uniref:Uncharacterized protein n=1 Tax=Euplotes crassus TaxID=5936 RepID=A0AAD1XQD3_EUPCR|nr:unnamed protein product [Moneuplotes crassus]
MLEDTSPLLLFVCAYDVGLMVVNLVVFVGLMVVGPKCFGVAFGVRVGVIMCPKAVIAIISWLKCFKGPWEKRKLNFNTFILMLQIPFDISVIIANEMLVENGWVRDFRVGVNVAYGVMTIIDVILIMILCSQVYLVEHPQKDIKRREIVNKQNAKPQKNPKLDLETRMHNLAEDSTPQQEEVVEP